MPNATKPAAIDAAQEIGGGLTVADLLAQMREQAAQIEKLTALKTPRDAGKTQWTARKDMFSDASDMVKADQGIDSDAFRLACALRKAHYDYGIEAGYFKPAELDMAAEKKSPGKGFRWGPVLERWGKFEIPDDFDVSALDKASHVMAAILGRLGMRPENLTTICEAYDPANHQNMIGAPVATPVERTSDAAVDAAAADAAADIAKDAANAALDAKTEPAKLPTPKTRRV